MGNTLQIKMTVLNVLLGCWLAITFATMAQEFDMSGYMTDGTVDVNKVEDALTSGAITADNAPRVTRHLVKQAPGLEEQITATMAGNFPEQAEDIRIAAAAGLMDSIESGMDQELTASHEDASQEQILENKFQIATSIAFTSDNETLQRNLINAAIRGEQLGLGSVSAVIRGVDGLSVGELDVLSKIWDYVSDNELEDTPAGQSVEGQIRKRSDGFTF